jgi:quinol monooxygenase YgiN
MDRLVVRLTVDLTVNEGKKDAFMEIAQAMTEGSQAEPGTLGYEWFFSADGMTCRLLEVYENAAAVEAHFLGPVVQQMVPKLAALCSVDGFMIYGDPGPVVSQMAAGFGAKFYSYELGINR